VDLSGDDVEIGGNSVDCTTNEMQPVRIHLERLKTRANQAQHDLAVLPKVNGRRSARQRKAYTRAQHAFSCASANAKNCVKDLHYKACSYLTANYDTIITPEFRSKEMLKPSSSRTHAFYEALLGLKHYAFRQLLAAKCKLLGKTLVVCSEMYTSLTCGCCSKLHLRLGLSRVFHCPQPDCGHTAGET